MNIQLMPGFGGKYVSEVFSDSSTTGADVIDTSKCAQLAIQMNTVSGSPTGAIQVEQSFDGENWASLGTSFAVEDGAILRYSLENGPYGLLRFNPTGITGTGSIQVTLVGFPVQVNW